MSDMSEDWNELWSFEDIDAVQRAVIQTLQKSGIKIPRNCREVSHSKRGSSKSGAVFFGVSLETGQQPSITYKYGDHGIFKLPRFLVEAVQFLEQHISRQGIFRKAGSVSRLKTLKGALDSGNASIPEDANVHDVAGLLKQYFRELPEPLITSRLFPVFEACYSLSSPPDRQRAVLLACLLLPRTHLQCLCVLMKLLHSVSEVAEESLMDASNLAIVLAPNIMRSHIGIITAAQGNPLKNQTGIAQLLIESSPLIGCVPEGVYAPKKPLRSSRVEWECEVKGQKSIHAVDVQNSVEKDQRLSEYNGMACVPKSSHSEVKVQKSLPDSEVKVQKPMQNTESKGQDYLQGTEVKVQNSLKDIQNSLDDVPKVQRTPASPTEEVEPAPALVLKEEEHVVSRQATPTPWTGSLLYVGVVGLLVLCVAMALSFFLYV